MSPVLESASLMQCILTKTLSRLGMDLTAFAGFPWVLTLLAACLSVVQQTTAGPFLPSKPMATARQSHTSTLLPSGKVLVTGGFGGGELASAELYNPDTGTWSPTRAMSSERALHTATLLPNGRVLIAAGFGRIAGSGFSTQLSSAELYNSATGTWISTGDLTTKRTGHTATLLPNGKVLIVGGVGVDGAPTAVLASAELYDPVTEQWTLTGAMNIKRYNHTTTLLPSGKVLVSGGSDGNVILPTAELYDPATGKWTATTRMATSRNNAASIVLGNGEGSSHGRFRLHVSLQRGSVRPRHRTMDLDWRNDIRSDVAHRHVACRRECADCGRS
jgi:WD40 repeat protein